MFHKNIPNNNKDIIRFLAKNFAGTKKVRNTILFCSIIIGIVAITMVFGIDVYKRQLLIRSVPMQWDLFIIHLQNRQEAAIVMRRVTFIRLVSHYMRW